jgi:hypothetical protein
MAEFPLHEQTFDLLTGVEDVGAHTWFNDDILKEAAHFADIPAKWGMLCVSAEKHLGKSGAYAWRKAIDAIVQATTAANVERLIDSTKVPLGPLKPQAPALPKRAQCDPPTWRTWLHQYESHSSYWAPRAAPSYHAAVGIWVLATIAARRIVLPLGTKPVYPTLFMGLVSESTLWTKSTAASVGMRVLKRAGCGHLLAPDRSTPQFLIKLMTGLVPQNYGGLSDEEQEEIKRGLAFAAQRGWFYEEWGGMLHQMRRSDSPHAELNKLLMVLEEGKDDYQAGTIQRGLEWVKDPYLTLLGCATIDDLTPYMEERNPYWRDGFWPRFAFVTAPYGEEPSMAPRPREEYQCPAELILPLHAWHARLGTPNVSISEVMEASGKRTGQWKARVDRLQPQVMSLDDDVYDAYEGYNRALMEFIIGKAINPDLGPWYARAHEKAIRVAMLLASFDGHDVISLPYWQEAQCIVESWRQNLHELVETANELLFDR